MDSLSDIGTSVHPSDSVSDVDTTVTTTAHIVSSRNPKAVSHVLQYFKHEGGKAPMNASMTSST
jgi:hypothetical protein